MKLYEILDTSKVLIRMNAMAEREPRFLTQGEFEGSFNPFDVYTMDNAVYFVENGTDGWKITGKANTAPIVYVYTTTLGSITYGSAYHSTRVPLRAVAMDFHNDNPDKKPIPNNRKQALTEIRKHYDNYIANDTNKWFV